MPERVNRQFRLATRPVGQVKETDFEYREEPIPTPKEGEMLVRNIYLSLEPTHRIWMSDRDGYMPAVELGAVMRGMNVSVVEESKNPQFQRGDLVRGLLGWQDYALITPANSKFVAKIDASLLPGKLTAYLGPLGMTGCTAYFGLIDVGQPKAGETILISAAAGAVGSLVGQMAKAQGFRVVGTAGTDEKCSWLKEELGFDETINYKKYQPGAELEAAIARTCPNGIDIYFDNVGGAILDAALTKVNLFARIPLCGLISTYNSKEPVPGPYNYSQIMMKRVRVQGFIVSDYYPRWSEAIAEIARWIKEGKIKYSLEFVEGLENAPRSLLKIFQGTNQGKIIIKISDEPG
jgi:hypothetical protein